MKMLTPTTPRFKNRYGQRMAWRVCVLATLLAICGSIPALAHIGPPYPIMQDRKVGPFTVAVWSNPDVGTGSFFVIIDPPPGGTVPSDMKVQVAVQPASKRLSEKAYDAWREKLRNRVEFKAIVPFDKEETWHVRVMLASSAGNGEIATDVSVTPTLLGRWDLLLFALPFLGVGLLWFKAMATKRENRRRAQRRKAQKSAV
jgi:hypothetical protein